MSFSRKGSIPSTFLNPPFFKSFIKEPLPQPISRISDSVFKYNPNILKSIGKGFKEDRNLKKSYQ